MSAAASTPAGINPNPRTNLQQIQNWQRLATFLANPADLDSNGRINVGISNLTLTVPSIFTLAGSPMTANGTLSLTLATQSANSAFMGPASGSAAAPTFRSLGAADLGLLSPGDLLVCGAGGGLTRLPIGTNGQVLTVVGGAPGWV